MMRQMQAPFEMTSGKIALEQILRDVPSDSAKWSEASTRFQFIDRLLVECLGWEKPYISVEQPDGDGGRSDYLLGTPPKVVVEAKRESVDFGDLPIGKPSVIRKLRPLLEASKALDSAVKQAIGYAVLEGIQVAVVANGPQIVVFRALTSGYSPLDGDCFFINGFDQILKDFPVLWRLLSPEGVSENRILRELSQHRNPRIPPKASEAFIEPKKLRYRSDFQEEIQSLSSLLLEDLEDNEELKSAFYRDCYVQDEANSRHLMLSKRVIAARYKRASEGEASVSAFELMPNKTRGKQPAIVDPSTLGASTARPIVVLGDVGVGKTSFFENLRHSLSDDQKKDSWFIHLNLGQRATLSKDVKSFTLSEIPLVLKRDFSIDISAANFCERVYSDDLVSFDDSPMGKLKDIDPTKYQIEKFTFLEKLTNSEDRHLKRSLQHISTKLKKSLIFIVDNADQRDFNVQQEAFLISQELADTGAALVFVALRPSTYFTSKNRGALSGYKNKIMTISPAPADVVIQKRIAFALRVAEGKESHKSISNIRMQLTNVVAFLKTTLRSIKSNDQIRQFIGNITGGNTRSVVELITSFFGSPNVNSEKIVNIELESGDYKVPLHEFTKHALLGDYSFFNQDSSQYACNIFDVSTSDPKEHFLGGMIIACLASSAVQSDADGFVFGDAIVEELMKFGFLENQINNQLRILAQRRLIETPHSHFKEITVSPDVSPSEFHFRATSIGNYHIRHWQGSFQFLDAVASDTPIFNEDIRSKVTRLVSSFEINDRYTKTVEFRDYLETCWHALDVVPQYYDFPAILKGQEATFDSVQRFRSQKRWPRRS